MLQLSPLPPIFHIWTPAIVHACRVDVAMLLVNTLSPGGKLGVSELGVPGAYLPAPHSVQDVAPSAVENLPEPQSAHAAEPVAALNFPAVHNTHVAPSGAVAPALQVQSVMTSDA